MALVEISRQRPRFQRSTAVGLTLVMLLGGGSLIYASGISGALPREDASDDVRWSLPPPPASLAASIAAPLANVNDAPAGKTLPTPPPAPQDARELNVSAPQNVALLEASAPSAAPVAEPAPAEPATAQIPPIAQPSFAKTKPANTTAPRVTAKNEGKAAAAKQPKPVGTVTRTAKPKASSQSALRAPVRAKVTELPPAPSITPEPAVVPQAPQDKRIPILSNIADGVNAVGNSLSSLVR